MDYNEQLNTLIDCEVEKRRQILIKLLDECCDFYRRKYEKVLSDVLITKAAEDVNFSLDVLSKVAPIAEKKVAAQLRSAMRLETEFRETQAENTEVTNTEPNSHQVSDVLRENMHSSNENCQRMSLSGVVPKSRIDRRVQPYPFNPQLQNLNMQIDPRVQIERNEIDVGTRLRSFLSPEMNRGAFVKSVFDEPENPDEIGQLQDRETTIEIGRGEAVDLTSSETHLIVAEKKPQALTFLHWDETEAGNSASNSSGVATRSMALQGMPELIKCLDNNSLIVGTWEDDLMFQLSYLHFNVDTNQLRNQTIFSAPGIICVATLPEMQMRASAFAGAERQSTGKFFAIQTSGALNIFSNFRSQLESPNCFYPEVYDAAAVRDSEETTFIAACFEHISFVQIVSVTSQGREIQKFQFISIEKPKRVLLPSAETLLVGCYPHNSPGGAFVQVLTRNLSDPVGKFAVTRKILDGKGLGNIWGLTMRRDILVVLHRRGSKAKLTKVALNL